jgi:hypothetical protein
MMNVVLFRRMNSNVRQTMTLFSMCLRRTSVEEPVLALLMSVSFTSFDILSIVMRIYSRSLTQVRPFII